MKKQWYVYILECQDGSFYTGVTNNLDARMNAHATGKGSKYVYKKVLRNFFELSCVRINLKHVSVSMQ